MVDESVVGSLVMASSVDNRYDTYKIPAVVL